MSTIPRNYNEPSVLDTLWDTVKEFAPYLIPTGLFLLGVVVFANAHSGWIFYSWDDNRYITENPLIKEGIGPKAIVNIFTDFYFAAYLPVTILSYAIEYTLWGMDPTGYHVVNILLHAANGVLVYLFMQRLQPRQGVALITALVFILHPLQVENVAWVAQRKSLLCMFFFMLTWITHIRATKPDSSPLWIVLAWFWFLLSVLSKPTAVLAGFLFLFYDYYWTDFGNVKLIWRNFPYFVIGAVGGVLMIIAHREYGGIKDAPGGTLLKSIGIMSWAFWDYTKSIVAPLNLNPLYIYNVDDVTITNLSIWLGLVVLVLLGLVAWFQPFGKPYSRFAVLWVVMMMLPVSNIIPIAIQRADRYMYFPMIVIGMIGSLAFFKLWEQVRDNGRYILAGVLGAMLAAFAVLSYQQNQVWRNEDTLWADNLKDYPSSETGLLNRGVHFFRERDFDTASVLFKELLSYYPNHYKGNRFLGLIYFYEQDYDQAVVYLERAVQLNSSNDVADEYVSARIELGRQAIARGEYQPAIDQYAIVARYDPEAAGAALVEMGVAFFDEEKYSEALQTYAAAAQIIPDQPVLYNNTGFTYYTVGDMQAAIAAYQKAVEIDPNYTRAWANMGDAALQSADYELARTAFGRAVELGATLDPESSSNYCLALAELKEQVDTALAFCQASVDAEPNNGLFLGRTAHALLLFGFPDRALPMAQRATEAAPNLSLGFRCLGDAQAALNNPQAAIAAYTRALELSPNNQEALAGLAAVQGQ